MKITLIGFMGSGKTTIAQQLGKELDTNTYDLDLMLEEQLGESIADFFTQYGEGEFRKHEHQLLMDTLHNTNGILSTGGGTPIQEANFRLLQIAPTITIFLDAEDDTIQNHLIHDGIEQRPLFKKLGMKGIIKLKHQRQSIYQNLADITINIDHKSPLTISAEIKESLNNDYSHIGSQNH